MRSNSTRSVFAIGLTVAVLALFLGLGIGYFAHQKAGFKTSQDVSQQIVMLEIDSSRIPIAGSPMRGGQTASATVVVFTDFQCLACRELYAQFIDAALKTHGDKLAVVYKAFPLEHHPDALLAAQAAAAAQLQDKFWPMFEAIYEATRASSSGDALKLDSLTAMAKAQGLDLERFKRDINSKEVRAMVRRDINLGQSLKVESTPSVFVNGARVSFNGGINQADLMDTINAEIARIDKIFAQPLVRYYVAELINDQILPKAMATYGKDVLGRPSKGAKHALVTMVVYSDYECPYCAKAEPTIGKLLEAYPEDLRVVFSHHPLDFHAHARLASQASHAAGLQGKFWPMHDLLVEHRNALELNDLRRYAERVGLDMNRFNADLESPETQAFVEANIQEASTWGISGTPNFLINGEVLEGAQSFDAFKAVIDKKMLEAKRLQDNKKLVGEELYEAIMKSVPKAVPKTAEGKVYVDINAAYTYGDPMAPVALVEFTDFECPYCARANATIMTLVEKNPGKVKVVFKHFPLEMHKNAEAAHIAAAAAGLQGKFWPYYELLFANRKALEPADLVSYAKQVGLNLDAFRADIANPVLKKLVADDVAQGTSLGVRGTPHFFINGTRISGALPYASFQSALDKELEIAEKYLAQGYEEEALYRAIIAGEDSAQLKVAAPAVLGDIDTTGDDFRGAADAVVTMIQFSEYQCPFAARVEPTMLELLEAYPGKLKIVFKHFPLEFHREAKLAAQAALAAGAQGKFWEMHALLFENQKALKAEYLGEYAKRLELDVESFEAALKNGQYSQRVEADIKTGQDIGVTGTPSFVINGKLIVGAQSIERFKTEIDAALAEIER